MLFKQVQAEAKRNGINLTNFNEVKESPYKVAVAVRFKKKNEAYRTFKFIADYNRFGFTINGCSAKFLEDPRHLVGNYLQLIQFSKMDNMSFELMCTMVLNFICYLPDVQKCYKKLRNQSLGFFIDIDADELLDTSVWGGTRKQLEIQFRNLLMD